MTARWVNVGAAVGSRGAGCGCGGSGSVRCDFGGVTPFVTEAEHCVCFVDVVGVLDLWKFVGTGDFCCSGDASFRQRNGREIE